MNKNIILIIALVIIAFHSISSNNYEKSLICEVNLNGTWKFSIMHSENWETTGYDDTGWDHINVPQTWESQGYNGYNGYGFYRKNIEIPDHLKENQLYLVLGIIDDVDEVYFNGKLIGSTGNFPPGYKSAWNASRNYNIPESLIKFGQQNTIAVKVFDMQGTGGIVKGNLGIYAQEFPIKPKIDLAGEWKFSTSNGLKFKDPDFNDSSWDVLMVPGIWENQGYYNYNGCAWYRKTFVVNQEFSGDKLVMLMGRVDDADQVYLNGVWIGQTGGRKWFETCGRGDEKSRYKIERSYPFPPGLLKQGENVVAVKVVDWSGEGGIYDGPIGIVEQTTFRDYWKKRSQKIRAQRNSRWDNYQ